MTLALSFLSNTAEERVEAFDIIPDSLRILPAAQLTTQSFAALRVAL